MSNDVAAPAASERSFVQNLIDLIVSPREAFEAILRKPGFWLALAFHLVIAAVFLAVWLHNVDPGELAKAQMVESGQWDKMTAEQHSGALAMSSKLVPIISWVSAMVIGPVFFVVLAAVLLFIYRFFYAGEVGFKKAMTIVCYSFLTFGIVTTPLTLLVYKLKGDWNINPQAILQANLSVLLDHDTTGKALWTLATSIDLTSFWLIFLLATGFGVAAKKPTGSAIWGVAIPWALIVLIKVGWVLITGRG
jgi:hypothetical protein